jgi:ribonuclease HI
MLVFDGSSHKQGAGAENLLLTPDGEQFKYMVHLDFKATNNMVEYEALIFGLCTALSLGVRQLLVKGDSQLIIKQVKGECSIFPVPTMQSLMSCQQRPLHGLLCLKESLSGDCSDLQPRLPNRVKEARPAP